MRELIEELGGTRAVSERLGLKLNRVSNWKRRGVPWPYRPTLAEWARRKGKKVPAGFLDAPEAA